MSTDASGVVDYSEVLNQMETSKERYCLKVTLVKVMTVTIRLQNEHLEEIRFH